MGNGLTEPGRSLGTGDHRWRSYLSGMCNVIAALSLVLGCILPVTVRLGIDFVPCASQFRLMVVFGAIAVLAICLSGYMSCGPVRRRRRGRRPLQQERRDARRRREGRT